MNRIREFNNSQFSKYYNDSRLLFKIISENYVSKDKYPQILEQISNIYNSRNPNEALKTIIEFTNGQQQQALLRIESLSQEEKRILINCTFDSNYDFTSKLLNPLIHSYTQSFPYESSKIGKPEYFNMNIRSYTSNSGNGNSLSIINGHIDYLQQIDSYIKSNCQKVETEITKGDEVKLNNQRSDNFFTPPNTNSIQSVMNNASTEYEPNKQEGNDISILMDDSQDELQAQPQGIDITNIMDEASNDDTNARINQYNEYRAQILPLLLSTDADVYVHSDFTIGGENGEICRHTLEKMTNDSRQILSQRDFEYDEVFRTGMLEPSLLDYAKTNPIVDGKVNTSDNGLSQYMAFSETNNTLTFNNISREYANYIDQEIKKVNPIVFQQQMEKYQQQVQNTDSYQRVLKKNSGFLNILMLSSIVGFMAGFISFITYKIIKMKGLG